MSTYTAKCDICGADNTVPSYGDWHCKQCGQGYEYDECHRISLTAAQWALLRNPPRWIPVADRLPVVGGRYLVLMDSRSDPFVDAATWSRGVWWSGFSPAEEWGMEITHWMPLPPGTVEWKPEPPEVK